MLTAEDHRALVRLATLQELEALYDVRDAYRAIELLLDGSHERAPSAAHLAPLLRLVGERFDAQLRRAHLACDGQASDAGRCTICGP